MKATRYLTVAYILILSSVAHAQQEMLYTQYFFSQLTINPAYAGNDNGLSLTALGKKQWIGLDGSPETYSFIGHTSIKNNNEEFRYYSNGKNKRELRPENKQIGLGLVLFNDKIGVNNTFISSLSYSYKILFSPEKRLSFGLQANVINFNQFFNELNDLNQSDQIFQNNIKVTRFNVGTGIFYESERYYIGFSIPEIIENSLSDNNASGEKQLRQYFFTGGYVFYLNRTFKFKPTLLMRYTEDLPMQFDINANFLYAEKLWIGVSYRYKNSVNSVLEFLISDKFRIGMAYDYMTSELNKVTNSSFEIMVNYNIKKSKKRIASPRYF